ncbi:hypothetical protein NC651_002276 [Populus alba x Populus x berolinensis]|nr:hypothetical protein NC651_002276 [Populus alba x Populus x berolinensis]
MVEPSLLAIVTASSRRGCKRNGKWWPGCWKGRMASATAAEERCGFCWFHHYG